MTTLTTRGSKGSELTHNELDANFDQDVKVKTTTYACLVSDNRSVIECNHASTPFTVTLGDAATMAAADTGDYEVTIANIGAAAVTVARAGSDTIDGAATSIVLQQYSSVTLKVNAATDGYSTIAHGGLGQLTATVAELNALDAGQAATTPTVAGGDSFVMDDDDVGTVKVDIDNVDTYFAQTTKTLTNKTLTSPVLNTGVSGTAILDEDDLISNSDTQLATQQSIKAYVDATLSSGTWTPTIQDDSLSDAESQAYLIQIGTYVKIGSTVFVTGRVKTTSIGTLTTTNSSYIAGLPFTSASTTNGRGTMVAGQCGGMAITANASVVGVIEASTDYIKLHQWDSTLGTSPLLISEFALAGAGDISFTAQYNV